MDNMTCRFFWEVTAIRGGNCSNGLNCGFAYVNLNNTASRNEWNNGAALYSYLV